jgi:hypothetical protein
MTAPRRDPFADIDFPDMAKKFYADLDALLLQTNEGLLDCITHWCAVNRVEPEIAGNYINANLNLKAKIHAECEQLHLVQKVRRLPI